MGELLSLLVGLLHPAHENPNNHRAAFAEYAASANWTSIHLGQFVGMAVIVAGLLVLFFALNVHAGTEGWVSRFAAVSAVVALVLYDTCSYDGLLLCTILVGIKRRSSSITGSI